MNAPSNSANPYAPPRAEVRDTGAGDEIQLAGRRERLGAAMLDSVIFFALVGIPLFMKADYAKIAAGELWGAFSALGIGLASLGGAILIAITSYLVYKNGQTIGKKVARIKVVRSDYSRASFARIFWLRNVVNAIPGMIPYVGNLYNLVDHLFIFGERRQCVHDKIADTVVIKA